MHADAVLTVLPTADFAAACGWYERLIGRPADRTPMAGLAEWQVTPGAWFQVYLDPDHAGATQLTVVVPDVDVLAAEVADRGLTMEAPQTVRSGRFRIGALTDPAGNVLRFTQVL